MKKESQKLFDEFEPVDRSEWEEVVQKFLKGADYREKLRWDSGEGFAAPPVVWPEESGLSGPALNDPGKFPYRRGRKESSTWEISEQILDGSPETCNERSKSALKQGVTALQFSLETSPREGMLGSDLRGVSIQNQKDLQKLLRDIDLTSVTIHFDAPLMSPILLAGYLNELKRQNIEPSGEKATFMYDPLTWGAAHGRWPAAPGKMSGMIAEMSRTPYRTLGVNAAFYHQCGATLVQELGTALAAGSEYLAIASESGVSPAQAAASVHMRLSVGPLYFPEIAKLRAARQLWSRVVTAYESEATEESGLYIHAETSSWGKSAIDPHSNLLRATTEAMSAVIGGADSVTVEPFDANFREPDRFSRRIARNIHHILQHEAHLDKATDPAAGSRYIEHLTDRIAAESWSFFQFIEKQGGFQKAVEGGLLQDAIKKSAVEKKDEVDRRKRMMIGVNIYPAPDESLPENVYRNRPVTSLRQSERNVPETIQLKEIKRLLEEGALADDLVEAALQPQKQLYSPLSPWRAGEGFESLRKATARWVKENGEPPLAILIPAGSVSDLRERLNFARNALEPAGFRVVQAGEFQPEDKDLFNLHGHSPEIAVLCCRDDQIGNFIPSFTDKFESGGNGEQRPVLALAALPKEPVMIEKEYGIDLLIHPGVNIFQLLTEIQKKLGIQ